MPFINPDDYDISFSHIKTVPKFLNTEQEFVQTNLENGLLIEVGSNTDLICSRDVCDRGVVDSGSFSMINSCSLPITVTGIEVYDSVRFSLFKYPDYKETGVYHSGNISEIPFTIKPREKKTISTYFHPLYEELEYGNGGTPENRTGDKFGTEVRMLPGFPIINCNKSPCDASFILTGELICDGVEKDTSLLKNDQNFVEPNPIPTSLQRIEADADPNQNLPICVPFEGEHTKEIVFTSENNGDITANFYFRANSDGKWETKIELSDSENTNVVDWKIGHQSANLGTATNAWIVVPDEINNTTDYPIFFAKGEDGPTTSYYSIHTYDDSFTEIINSPNKPNGFIELPLPITVQPPCIPSL